MRDCIIRSLIIILSSVSIGMIIGLFFRKTYDFHGPNAEKYSKKIFRDNKKKKCFHFVAKPI